MNTQHTPGPWRYARGNGSPTTGEHMIAGATPGYLAEVRDVGSGSVVANARLIAAAPDLLAALEETLESLLAHLRQAHRVDSNVHQRSAAQSRIEEPAVGVDP